MHHLPDANGSCPDQHVLPLLFGSWEVCSCYPKNIVPSFSFFTFVISLNVREAASCSITDSASYYCSTWVLQPVKESTPILGLTLAYNAQLLTFHRLLAFLVCTSYRSLSMFGCLDRDVFIKADESGCRTLCVSFWVTSVRLLFEVVWPFCQLLDRIVML